MMKFKYNRRTINLFGRVCWGGGGQWRMKSLMTHLSTMKRPFALIIHPLLPNKCPSGNLGGGITDQICLWGCLYHKIGLTEYPPPQNSAFKIYTSVHLNYDYRYVRLGGWGNLGLQAPTFGGLLSVRATMGYFWGQLSSETVFGFANIVGQLLFSIVP